MAELTHTDIRERVRERYAAAANAAKDATSRGCCASSAYTGKQDLRPGDRGEMPGKSTGIGRTHARTGSTNCAEIAGV